MANPAPIISQINAFNATEGTIISFNIVGGTSIVRSNIIYIYDLSDNSLICTHLYISTESIHELPANTDPSIAYASGKSSADFTNGKQYYAQIQTFTNTAGTEGASGASIAKLFWCLVEPTLTINTIPSSISTTSYNVGAVYNSNTTATSNIVQQYQFNLYSATGVLVQSSGVITGSGAQQGTSTAYDLSYNFTGLNVGSSYYVTAEVTTTQGMTVSAQSSTFTVSIDTPTLGEATVVNNACDGYISVTSNLSGEYGGSASGEIATFETDSVNDVSSLKVTLTPQQDGTPWIGTTHDTTPYLHRAMPTQSNDYNRESGVIVGGTVAWNQLFRNGNFENTTWWVDTNTNKSTFTVSDNIATITYTGTPINNYDISLMHPDTNFVTGHKYLASCDIKTTRSSRLTFDTNGGVSGFGGMDIGTSWAHFSRMSVGTVTAKKGVYIYPRGLTDGYGNGDTFQVKNVSMFDLTQMFGSTIADYIYSLEQANAGAGVAWFKKLFPKSYYPYDAGSLQSVKPTAHVTTGFNQWDEEWELGDLNTTNGANYPATNRIRSKNYIRVLPNTTYYFKSPYNSIVCFYDEDKNFVNIGNATLTANATFTTQSNIHYMRISPSASYGTVYKNDICINISKTTGTPKNGDYVPYVKHTYVLDSDLVLRGIPKLDASNNLYYDGDTYASDGTVTRNTIYRAYQSGDESLANAITDGTNTVVYSANASTETAQAYTNPQIVDPDGTEEYVTSNYVPVGHDSTYSLVCPISGYDEVSAVVSPTTTASDGQTYEADLPQTVYGGTVDLVSGEVVIDRAMVDLGTLNWSTPTASGRMSASAGAMPITSSTDLSNVISDTYATITARAWYDATATGISICGTGYGTDGNIGISDPNLAGKTSAEAKSYVTGIYAVYKLATPQTIQLTPQEIQTLVGTNNVWSDSGDVEITYNIPITNLLVKRQDVADVSGTWLTLYSQSVTQASDMDFTFIDFLNQYGKTYKYALVPLLTQTQSGVEVEVEGGYTVSDEVVSIFDGVFVADNTAIYKLKAGVNYGDLSKVQEVGSINTIGSQYPIIVSNSKVDYRTASLSATIVADDYYDNGNLNRMDMVQKRELMESFFTNKRAKILKDWNGNIWLVVFIDNINISFINEYGMGIATLTATWTEIGDVTSEEDLQNTRIINVG